MTFHESSLQRVFTTFTHKQLVGDVDSHRPLSVVQPATDVEPANILDRLRLARPTDDRQRPDILLLLSPFLPPDVKSAIVRSDPTLEKVCERFGPICLAPTIYFDISTILPLNLQGGCE